MADPQDPSQAPPLQHRHDEKLDYSTEHTGADPANVGREEYIHNDEKTLPSDNKTSLFVAIGAAVVAIVGLILSFAVDVDLIGFIVAVLGLVIALVAVMMAWGDARASAVTPALVAIATGIVAVVCLFDFLGAENAAPEAIGGEGEGVVDNGLADQPLLDEPGGDAEQRSMSTVQPGSIPDDPAEITPDQVDTGSVAVDEEEAEQVNDE